MQHAVTQIQIGSFQEDTLYRFANEVTALVFTMVPITLLQMYETTGTISPIGI